MPILTAATITVVGLKIIDALSAKAIQDGGGKFITLFKDKRSDFVQELSKTINETIEQFAEEQIKKGNTDKIPSAFFLKTVFFVKELFSLEKAPPEYPFYLSQAIVEELLKYRFSENYSFKEITKI